MDSVDGEQNSPLKVILMATDGSEFGLGTERVAMAMAQQHGSHLHVLRLLLSGHDPSERDEAEQHMARVEATSVEKGITCTTMLRPCEDPADGILDAAREVGANLILVGRRGKRGLARFMVGKATAEVIAQAPCHVLVVPRLVTMWSSGVLLVSVHELSDDTSLDLACHLAKASSLPLTALMMADGDENDPRRREANQLANRIIALAKQRDIPASGMVEHGDIEDAALEVARQRAADLIVTEYHDDRSIVDRLLFNAHSVIQMIGRANCPVLVVKKG
jgi:nucleotide-binding universal stress UspA family protein